MAFIDEDMEDSKYADFYNVSYGVGMGNRNWMEDVMLVQFFLHRIYLFDSDWNQYKPSGTLTVDGVSGPITRRWILKFQSDCREDGDDISVDGIVDRAGNAASNWESSISTTIYTIRYLNNIVRNGQNDFYRTMPYNQQVPPLLRLSFMRMNSEKPGANFPITSGD